MSKTKDDVYKNGGMTVSGHGVTSRVTSRLAEDVRAFNRKRAGLSGVVIHIHEKDPAKIAAMTQFASEHIAREDAWACQAQGYQPFNMIDLEDGTFLLYEKSDKMPIARVNRMAYRDGKELGEVATTYSRHDSDRRLMYKLNRAFMKHY